MKRIKSDLIDLMSFEYIIALVGLIIASFYAPNFAHILAAWSIVGIILLFYFM